MKLAIALLLSMVIGNVDAWFGTGHLLVARMAQMVLEKQEPEVFNKCLELLKHLTDANKTKDEDMHPFTECATYADDLYNESEEGKYQFQWHFVDTPLLDESSDINEYNFTKPVYNNSQAIPALCKWLKGTDDFKTTPYYTTVMKHVDNEQEGISTAIRLLIHYVGDIHQPLHATSRVNSEYPEGDMGGNLFPLPNELKELHAVWDSVLFKFSGYPVLPMNDSLWDDLSNTAQQLTDEYMPRIAQNEIENLNATAWAQESFHYARDFVYKYAKENTELTDEYLKAGEQIAKRRLVLAGHRLAHLLTTIIKDEEINPEVVTIMEEASKQKADLFLV